MIPDCSGIDVIGYSSQAAFFSGSNSNVSRYIETVRLDLTMAMYSLKFDIYSRCFTGIVVCLVRCRFVFELAVAEAVRKQTATKMLC